MPDFTPPPLPSFFFTTFSWEQAWIFILGTLTPAYQGGKGLSQQQLGWMLDQMLKYAEINSKGNYPDTQELRAILGLPQAA